MIFHDNSFKDSTIGCSWFADLFAVYLRLSRTFYNLFAILLQFFRGFRGFRDLSAVFAIYS
jgi:hypothetical protein